MRGPIALRLRDHDEAVLVDYAQQMDGCLASADPAEFEGAQRNLIANRNYLFEELGALDQSLRRRLAEFLETNCQVVVISTNDTDNAFRIFMVVNQVGKASASQRPSEGRIDRCAASRRTRRVHRAMG